MNGSQIKIVIDTNILFMAIYGKSDKAAKIIEAANENKISLFAPDTVKIELTRVLKRRMNFSENELEIIFESLPVSWIEREIYQSFLDETTVKHKADKPIEALAAVLSCGILSADKHFKNVKHKIDINELLKELEK